MDIIPITLSNLVDSVGRVASATFKFEIKIVTSIYAWWYGIQCENWLKCLPPCFNLIFYQIAKRQAVVNPENTFFSVKRFIGRKGNEVQEECKQIPYKVSAS